MARRSAVFEKAAIGRCNCGGYSSRRVACDHPQYAHDGVGQDPRRGVIGGGIYAAYFFLDDLQEGLARVRRSLDPNDPDAATRGREIVNLHKFILAASALIVVWAVVFKLHCAWAAF
jgi:hypothetical protein